MDVDDLLWIHPQGHSTWELTITIPRLLPALDATGRGPQIINRAIQRGFTRYLPQHRSPMLPVEIEKQASLLPGHDRPSYTLSLSVDLKGPTCTVGAAQLQRTWVTPLAKLTYGQTDHLIEAESTPLAQTLKLLYTVALRLQNLRRNRGAIGSLYDLQSGQISGEEGQLLPMSIAAHRSHLIVSELMILANHTLALLAWQRQIPTLFRNHTAQEGRLDRMQKAHYTLNNQGHLGLGLSAYGHFTSPLRRAVDLINQLCTLEALVGGQPWFSPDHLSSYAQHLTQLPWEEQEKREVYYRQRTLTAAIAALEQEEDLDSSQLQVLVKAVYRSSDSSGSAGPDTVQPIPLPIQQCLPILLQDRLTSGRLKQISLETMALLLVTPSTLPDWEPVRRLVAEQVFEISYLAAQIWNHLIQSEQLQPPQVIAESLGSAHAPHWKVTASYQSLQAQIERPQKKQAEQQALAVLLAQIGGVDLSGLDFPRSTSGLDSNPLTNWKGQVLEKVAQQGWPAPQVSLHRIGGPDHDPLFAARVDLEIPAVLQTQDSLWIRGEAQADSKKVAEQLAFHQIWEQLHQIPDPTYAPDALPS